MKHCVFCGAPLKDSDSYCPSCGIVYDDAESIALKEAMVENDDSQEIKKAKYCDSCGALLKDSDDYCPDCGAVCSYKAVEKRTEPFYLVTRIIAVLLILNIVFIPSLCNKFWSIGDGDTSNKYSFLDMIGGIADDIRRGYSYSDYGLPILYYFGGLACALFIFVCALRERLGACTAGSLVGVGLSLFIFYQIYSGNTRYYVGLNYAHLTFGFYISCAGFISILIASLYKNRE